MHKQECQIKSKGGRWWRLDRSFAPATADSSSDWWCCDDGSLKGLALKM